MKEKLRTFSDKIKELTNYLTIHRKIYIYK